MSKYTLYSIYCYSNQYILKYLYRIYFITKFREKNKFQVKKNLD